MSKKILITGVAGFIGSHVARRFIEQKYEVYGIDDLSTGYKKNVPTEVKFIKADLAKKNTYKFLPKNCDYILHLAGQSSGEISFSNPISDLDYNRPRRFTTWTGKIRKDKKPSYEDCGLKQIIRISGIAKENFKEQNNKNLPKSKLIKKEVIKKESKKGIAIKKFVL